MHLHDLTIKKFHHGLMNKEFSAFEITEAFLKFIEKKDKEIGAYLQLMSASALRQAKDVDVRIAAGESISKVAGLPLAVKDNILIKDELTTAASKILETYRASYDATVIEKLRALGAVFLGKTNLDEFAMGASTENSAFKITRNPHDFKRVPGGSSGGSAAAVASTQAIASLGSDTNGSVRQPAAFCGVVGFKPTYGAVSRYGLIAMASSFDQIGPITKTVEDAEILFDAIKGKDPKDSTSVEINKFQISRQRRGSPEAANFKFQDAHELRIGIPKEYFIEGLDVEVKDAVNKVIKDFESLRFKITSISLPHTKYALASYYIITPAEISANLARYDGIRYPKTQSRRKVGTPIKTSKKLVDLYCKNRSEGFGEEVKRRIILGTFVLSSGYYDAYYLKAQKVRSLIKTDFDKAFNPPAGGVDLILTPVAPTPAFEIGEKIKDPLAMYLADIFTSAASLAGLPAISIPARHLPKDKLPIGFQIIGRPFRDSEVLKVGKLYEAIYR